MAENKKGRKVGRSKRNGQNLKYKNEHRAEQNKLRRLKKHIKTHGVTGNDALAAIRRLEIVLYGAPATTLPVNAKKRSAASAAFYRLSDAEARRKQMRDISLGLRKAA